MDHTINSIPTMARATKSGALAAHATSLATGRDYQDQVRLEKARKKYEAEQAEKKKNGTNDRESRAKAIEIEALYDAPDAEATLRHVTTRNPGGQA
jgi:hypothetical protein